MPLTRVKFLPGIDKQNTTVGAEGRWVDCDNVRFRYQLPEKVGGWSSLVTDTIVGVARKMFPFVDLDGNRYVAIGTDKLLLLYFEGQLYDITPLDTQITNATIQTFSGSSLVTITTSTAHGLEPGDIVFLDDTTLPGSSGYSTSDFDDKKFQVTNVLNATQFQVTVTTSGTPANAGPGGSIDIAPYVRIGPAAQSYGYGWGISEWQGSVAGAATSTLNGALLNDTNGTGGSGTSITLASTTNFTSAGRILVESELISYASIAGADLQTIVRGVNGTDKAAHSDGTAVTDATNFSDWGEATVASTVQLEPGLWSLDNFGQVLVATIANGKTFTWDAGGTLPLTTRAATTTSGFATGNNPTATRASLISPTTRHLIHLGTETTIGDPTTQDDMFIRFSDQEDINTYTPSVTNAAGTQRLQDGSRIIGALKAKETILIWTDNALYTMKFVGAPFTFGFEQVGTNCGLIGKNAAVEVDGVAYWMSPNGFFLYDGTVKTLTCSVEDYVFDQLDITKGQQVNAGLNNLFGEVTWYYPTTSSTYNNQYVVYNYGESAPQLPIWYIGSEARTSWIDGTIYPKPFGTKFDSTAEGTFPTIVGVSGLGQTTLFEHEIGTDQINPDGTTTTVASNIKSFDFDLDVQGTAGQFFLFMRRILPDFKNLQGDSKITMSVKRFPQQSDSATTLSPFTVSSSTNKLDTRTRGRYANIKIENDGASQSWRFGTITLDLQPDGRR
tara:strand:- start:431 stop:2611 length:2181 start_codon:yes stop_codon:yes gene_type:complete